MEGTSVILTSTIGFNGFALENQLLARWWINGSPVEGKRPDKDMPALDVVRESDLPNPRRTMTFRPDLSDLGAKRGDNLALQLLYCEQSWRPVSFGNDTRMSISWERDLEPLLSNRVEFRMP
jgi:hypothetical protein